jgi:putative heme-binding domain-containing protein
MGGEGQDVGPALTTVRHRSPEEILVHVLDPNREVSPDWVNYAVALTDGRVLTGVIVGQTETSLTLRRAEGVQDTVSRTDVEEISSTGQSLMPEGLEQSLTLQETADLIRYLLDTP